MNTRTAIALAAAALLAGATAAPSLAATSSSAAKPNPSAAGLTLSKAQRKTAWNDLHGAAVTATPSAKYADKVGAKVPRTVPLMGMSSKAKQAVPKLKSYDFTMAQGKLLIVNPKSRKIAEVING